MDAIPADCITLPEAVAARAKIMTDFELEREFGDCESFGEAWKGSGGRSYLCHELAVRELYRKFIDGSIETFVRDSVSGEILRLPEWVWQHHGLWRQTICGGVVRATACEELLEFNDKLIALNQAAFERYMVDAKRRKPASMKEACQNWLENLLRNSPHKRPKTKAKLREEAMARFGVTWREFDACWKAADKAVPDANWRRPGAPKKS